VALSAACKRDKLYPALGLGHGVFFDKETFGVDRLVAGAPSRHNGLIGSWPDCLARPPPCRPQRVCRARFGRIAIANSDAGATAYTDCAIDQAHRAVGELLAL
jgi:spermidine dehydrogenase